MPTPGKVSAFHAAGGSGVRVDSCLYSGYSVPPFYDSLIAKLIVHGDDRAHCLARLKRALAEFVVEPIPTTLDLHERLVDAPAVLAASYNIRWLEEHFLSDDQAGRRRPAGHSMAERFAFSPETLIKAYSLGVFPRRKAPTARTSDPMT